MKIQVRERQILSGELETELWQVGTGQLPVISDAAAVTIASWYQSPGGVGAVLAAFASGCEVDHVDLIDAIHRTACTHTSPELSHLAAWVHATAEDPKAADDPQAGREQPEPTTATNTPERGDVTAKQARAHDLADALGRSAGHLAARTADQDVFAERERPTGESFDRYPVGSVDEAFRAGFGAGWDIWANYRATQHTKDTAPFEPYDAAELAACLKTYDGLQPEATKAAELFAKAESDPTLYREADEKGRWYDIEARQLLDALVTALRGPGRFQRVHYSELVAGDIVTDHETQFQVIARGEYTHAGRTVQWASTEAITQPSDQLRPFVNDIGDPWRLQAREDIAYAYRITAANPLTH